MSNKKYQPYDEENSTKDREKAEWIRIQGIEIRGFLHEKKSSWAIVDGRVCWLKTIDYHKENDGLISHKLVRMDSDGALDKIKRHIEKSVLENWDEKFIQHELSAWKKIWWKCVQAGTMGRTQYDDKINKLSVVAKDETVGPVKPLSSGKKKVIGDPLAVL